MGSCPKIKPEEGKGEGFASESRGDVRLLPEISASSMKLGCEKGSRKRKPSARSS